MTISAYSTTRNVDDPRDNMKAPIDHLVGELRERPFSLLTLLAVVLGGLWGFSAYARIAQLTDLEQRFDGRIVSMGEQLARTDEKIDRVLVLQIAERIRTVYAEICESDALFTRGVLRRTLDDLQSEHRRIEGGNYPLERCPQAFDGSHDD